MLQHQDHSQKYITNLWLGIISQESWQPDLQKSPRDVIAKTHAIYKNANARIPAWLWPICSCVLERFVESTHCILISAWYFTTPSEKPDRVAQTRPVINNRRRHHCGTTVQECERGATARQCYKATW